MKRSNEPFFWALFSGGGMLAALLLPAIAFVLWVAAPMGWIEAPSYSQLMDKVRHPLIRAALFVFISACLFHWSHRFRFTLYDGLQLKHLFGLIAFVCYGGATALTLIAGYVLWTLG